MPSIGTSIAPSQNKLKYFLFFNEAGNILPLKKQYPALPEPGFCTRSGVVQFRVTILAESLSHFIGLAVGETAAILSVAKDGMRRG